MTRLVAASGQTFTLDTEETKEKRVSKVIAVDDSAAVSFSTGTHVNGNDFNEHSPRTTSHLKFISPSWAENNLQNDLVCVELLSRRTPELNVTVVLVIGCFDIITTDCVTFNVSNWQSCAYVLPDQV